MASGNEVVLKFSGDSKSLERTFGRVGAGAKDMAADMDKASDRAKGLGGAMSKVGETVDSSESKFMGTADVLDGLATTMGFNISRQIELARGFGDIAGGLTNLGPLFSGVIAKLGATTVGTWAANTATTAWAAAQTGLNAVLAMNPIGLTVIAIAALVGAFVLAWKHSETFRDVVRGALNTVKGIAEGLWEFFRTLPDKLGSIGSRVVDVLTWPYRTAFNMIARLWNDTVGRLSFEFPSWIPGGVGGKGFSMPRLPTYHQGGVIPGSPGQAIPILAMAGERVIPAGQSGGMNLTINAGTIVSENQLADLVQTVLLRKQQRTGPLGLL